MTTPPHIPLAPEGAVVLVSCYELGHEPLGLVAPAGVLERAGFTQVLIDIAFENLDDNVLTRASIIAISVPMHTALRLGVRVAARVRRVNPKAHICFYGIYAELNADYLRTSGADTCLGAEFEEALVGLVRCVLGAPPGVAPRDVRFLPLPRSRTHSLDLTPSRRRRHSGYTRLDDGHALRDVGYVTTTRGCKHRCLHCPLTPVYDGRFYAITADSVLADVAEVVATGATHLTFADPDFLNGPGHARRIARRIHESFPRVTFDFTAKIEHLLCHHLLVEELRALGALFVVSAVESFNDDVLASLHKGHTRADALAVIRYFRGIDLSLRPSLLPFTPWETLDSFIDLLDTVAAEGLIDHIDAVQYSIRLLVPPGSRLLESDAMHTHLGALDAENFTYAWRHSDPRMDRLHATIALAVERAAALGEDAAATFAAVRRAAYTERDGFAPAEVTFPTPRASRERVPRLTEAWFC